MGKSFLVRFYVTPILQASKSAQWLCIKVYDFLTFVLSPVIGKRNKGNFGLKGLPLWLGW